MEAGAMSNESDEAYPSSSRPVCFDEMPPPLTLDKKPAGARTAVNIVLSALLYLFDFATNVTTLHTYYLLSYKCFRDEAYTSVSECDLARETSLDFNWVFPASLSIMLVAHVSNSIIFGMTLPAAEHPLRFAYFLPLIHLSRLFKVMWRTCNCNGLKDFQDSQEELSSLYNVLAASLETVPQFMLQFHVVMQLGTSYTGESGPQVPRNLIVSLVAAIVSGIYNGSMAVLFLVQKSGLLFPWKAFIPLIAGFHTFAAIAARTVIVAALLPLEGYTYTYLIPILSYFFVGTIIIWFFFGFLLHKSHRDSFSQSSHKWINQMRHAVHSLALTHVSLFIGPMYVIVKLFDEPYFFLLWGTLLHVFIEILGLIFVFVSGRVIIGTSDFVIPCQRNSMYSNKYLTCNVFLIVVCPSLVFLLLSIVLFDVVSKRGRHEVFIREGENHEEEMADAELTISNGLEEKAEVELALLPNFRQPTSSIASSKLYIFVIMVLFIKKLSHKKRNA